MATPHELEIKLTGKDDGSLSRVVGQSETQIRRLSTAMNTVNNIVGKDGTKAFNELAVPVLIQHPVLLKIKKALVHFHDRAARGGVDKVMPDDVRVRKIAHAEFGQEKVELEVHALLRVFPHVAAGLLPVNPKQVIGLMVSKVLAVLLGRRHRDFLRALRRPVPLVLLRTLKSGFKFAGVRPAEREPVSRDLRMLDVREVSIGEFEVA